MKIGILPQKPVEIRYQQEWFDYLVNYKEKLEKTNDIELDIIYDKKLLNKESVKNKSDFFDNLNDSIKWETRQIEILFKKLSSYHALFFLDISFTGLYTSIIPLIKLVNPNIKLYGFCHATSLNKSDIFKNTRRLKWKLEKYVIDSFDQIFVSTEYHKNKLIKRGRLNSKYKNKITVTYGLPIGDSLFKNTRTKQENYIVIPSRINKQKLSQFKKEILKKKLESIGYKVIETYSVCKTRQDYVNTLKKSKAVVVISNEDTFGYPLAEATVCNIPCFANRSCCYPEILTEDSLFSDFDELVSKIKSINNSTNNYKVKDTYILSHNLFWNRLINKIKGGNV